MKGKKVWITGAGSGIGRALAIAAAEEGAKLVLSGRKSHSLEETKSLLPTDNDAKIVLLDLEQHDQIEDVYNTNHSLLKNVDILINNAGISQRSLVNETSFEVYKKLMDVNYLGTIKLSQLMLKDFNINGHGHFVNISSSAGKFGVPLRSGYSASKFALHGFFEALRAENKKENLHITMVCPGFINTDISKNALKADGSSYGTMDDAQANGMPVKTMAIKTIAAIKAKKAEFNVGGFKEAHMAIWMSRMLPSLFRKFIANTKVT